MNTTVEEESPTKLKLTVKIEPEEIAPEFEKAVKRLAREVKIPGFRPGKAPRSVVESRIGKEAIKEEVLRDALPSFYARAAEEVSLRPVTHPDIDVTHFEEGDPLTFTATVEVRPEINLPEYKGIEVARPALNATDEEVSAHLDRLREQFGVLEEVARNAVKGDYATIDIFGSRNGESIPGLTAEDLTYEVGSESFLPELDKELEGKRTGDILKFSAVLPERLRPALGEDGSADEPLNATFQVVVKQIQSKQLPAPDDEFAKLASEFDTLDELKAELRNRVESAKKNEADMMVGDRILEDLLDRAEVPVPEALVAQETEARLARLIRELEKAGLTLEQYLESNQGNQEELVKGAREAAERTVAADLLLDAVAKAENIEVDPKDVAIEVAALARHANREAEELMKELSESGRVNVLAGDILRRKALHFLVEHAEISDEPVSSGG